MAYLYLQIMQHFVAYRKYIVSSCLSVITDHEKLIWLHDIHGFFWFPMAYRCVRFMKIRLASWFSHPSSQAVSHMARQPAAQPSSQAAWHPGNRKSPTLLACQPPAAFEWDLVFLNIRNRDSLGGAFPWNQRPASHPSAARATWPPWPGQPAKIGFYCREADLQ